MRLGGAAGAAVFVLSLASFAMAQQTFSPSPSPGVRYNRLLIRNAMVVDGAGNPARGPMDIVIEGATITSVRPARPINEFGTPTGAAGAAENRPGARSATAENSFDRVIDATGMYVTPGIIDV